ncbi:beta-ketoacyl-[acyl-carrier-protein] synthase family protein [Variovorax paradoxus]|nr:beta-ketoacyl-[acyl-carrier-protein] synthase family protein [Variovorax paradoxus]
MRPRYRDRIVITGIGALTPLGNTLDATWQRVLRGESAAREWADLAAEGHRAVRACRIEGFAAPDARRGRELAIAAAREALRQAGRPATPDDRTCGIFVGSTLGESAAFEQAAAGADIDLSDHRVASFADGLARAFELEGPREALATACAAGNYAIGAAALALRRGGMRWALAGGVEPFSRLSMVGFSRSRAMADGDCRPFDAKRSGMVLGEGAAMFVLERAEHALARGARPLAEVLGLGLSCDAYHPTAPRPDGRGMARAMQAALENSTMTPGDVDWVNLHGSGTRASDAAEALALRTMFDAGPMPLLSGSKGSLGHALGAASAIEAALCVCGLLQQAVPPTAGHEMPDPESGLECTRSIVRPTRPLRVVVNNAFAFGGLNSALALARWEPTQ